MLKNAAVVYLLIRCKKFTLQYIFPIMWDVRVCAACLATDVRMYSMSAASLLEPYRLLTGIELETEGMPQKLCWECAALVHKFNLFRRKCDRASLLLQDIYNQHDEVSEQDVLRVNREQHNLISSYSICPILVYNVEYISKSKKFDKDISSDNATIEPFVKLEMEMMKKEEIPIEIKSDDDDTEPIDDVVEEDCSQAVLLESPQKIKPVRKRRRHSKLKEKRETKMRDIGMTEELLSPEQHMEVMRERQNSKIYKSARFPCTFCYISFREERTFNNHKLKHDPISGDFICDVCKLRYKTKPKLYAHIRTLHMKRYSCRSCPAVFYHGTAAVKHYAWHKGVVYTCPVCEATFHRTTTYQSHLRIKHSSEHVCDQCGEPFHSKKGLLQHINLSHKLKRDTVAIGGDHETSGPYCAECDIQFTCKQAWTRHVLISPKHQHEKHICALGCEICGETLPDEERLRAHRVTHGRLQKRKCRRVRVTAIPITCEQCGEVMESSLAYHAHFRRVHPEKTRTYYPAMRARVMCELCGKIFQSKAHLKQHSYKHTGERKHTDERRHMNERRYKCDMCSKKFTTKKILSDHIFIHTEELPYKCNICGQGFNNDSNMKRHKSVHTNATPYACEICGKGFKYRMSMKDHINFVHMKKPRPKRERSKRQYQRTAE